MVGASFEIIRDLHLEMARKPPTNFAAYGQRFFEVGRIVQDTPGLS